MKPLIRITTEPIEIVRYSQSARLVSSSSVDVERRKALARSTMHRRSSQVQSISVEDVTRINRTFSRGMRSQTASQVQDTSQKQIAYRRTTQPSVPVSSKIDNVGDTVNDATASVASTSVPVSPSVPDVSMETTYVADRGSFEMRVARGDLTYLPPMIMTIITQRPQVHVEYLGDFNYVPPRDGDSGGNVNLFT